MEKRAHFFHFQEAQFFHAALLLMRETPKVGAANYVAPAKFVFFFKFINATKSSRDPLMKFQTRK